MTGGEETKKKPVAGGGARGGRKGKGKGFKGKGGPKKPFVKKNVVITTGPNGEQIEKRQRGLRKKKTKSATAAAAAAAQKPKEKVIKNWEKVEIDTNSFNHFAASGLVGLEVIDAGSYNTYESGGGKGKRKSVVAEVVEETTSDTESEKKSSSSSKKNNKQGIVLHEREKEEKEGAIVDAKHKNKKAKKGNQQQQQQQEDNKNRNSEEFKQKKKDFEEFRKEQRVAREQKKKEFQLQDRIAPEAADTLDMTVWESYNLDPLIIKGLRALGYERPTEIQSQVIPASIQSGNDIIGAAETGSGKTLAFGIPMVNTILKYLRAQGEDVTRSTLPQVGLLKKDNSHKKLLALVLCPTRELAIQVTNHLRTVALETSLRIISVVGGLSQKKQDRELNSKPEIVVATPGRLWELIDEGDKYLGDFTNLLCFGIDEADRMVEKGVFREIDSILERLPQYQLHYKKGQNDEEQEEVEQDEDEDQEEQEDAEEEEQQEEDGEEEEEEQVDEDQEEEEEMEDIKDIEDIEDIEDIQGMEELEEIDGDDEEIIDFQEGEIDPDDFQAEEVGFEKFTSVKRQTFIFSATIVGVHDEQQKDAKKKKKYANKELTPLQTLISKINFHRKYKLIDCTLKKLTAHSLKESKILCNLDEKDQYLYYFIDRYPGKTLVFVNSVDCIRRLLAILKLLKVVAFPLHAQMEQRQRLRNLDHFKREKNVILIATDVAARGLDIPGVEHVVHYQMPRTIELYVHRSGRTARSNREGISVLFVDPSEQKTYAAFTDKLEHEILDFPIDFKFMPAVRERIGMAYDIDKQSFEKKKVSDEKNWYLRNAKAIDMQLDDVFYQSDSEDEKDKQYREKSRLNQLKMTLDAVLAQPLMPSGVSRRYGAGIEEWTNKKNARATLDLEKSKSKKKCDGFWEF
ncbi:putative RNA helicase [Cavenderia fasciculata]|uniref:ATP-dependent RNA helicase n=1 Tax=Cavenderia fasciculata TaxID=261658 RepID=F4PUE4_CACFS|nr:putative RNA helicase [Cavenderia fasciculata]EGG21016.1 putative RNA helicase [Cavenderia fasciculata]|eukprot:XP_004358866.1 putative RNA helicase [Cavenderia fasciculata]